MPFALSNIAGVAAFQNCIHRDYMEDRIACACTSGGSGTLIGALVADGHGGHACSSRVCQQRDGLLDRILSRCAAKGGDVKEIVKSEFARFEDEEFTKEKSGSTACMVIFDITIPFNPELHVANLGDSRSIGVSKDGKCSWSTEDHKPRDPAEKAAIEARGGWVNPKERVNGTLAVARSLGDCDVKGVGKEPDVTERDIRSTSYVVIACDGLWDVMKNEHVAAFVKKKADNGFSVNKIAKALVTKAQRLDTNDNTTVMVLGIDLSPPEIVRLRGAVSGETK